MNTKVILKTMFFMVLVMSCNSTLSLREQWVGKTKNELLYRYGVPDLSTSDGRGGEVIAYKSISNRPGYKNIYDGSKYVQIYDPNLDKSEIKKSFFINSSGKIYDVEIHSTGVNYQNYNPATGQWNFNYQWNSDSKKTK